MSTRARYHHREPRWADDWLSILERHAGAVEINPTTPRPGRYTCLPCNRTFTAFQDLVEHRTVCPHRNPNSTEGAMCDESRQPDAPNETLDADLDTPQLVCDECAQAFDTAEEMSLHDRTCHYCGKVLANYRGRRIHEGKAHADQPRPEPDEPPASEWSPDDEVIPEGVIVGVTDSLAANDETVRLRPLSAHYSPNILTSALHQAAELYATGDAEALARLDQECQRAWMIIGALREDLACTSEDVGWKQGTDAA